MKRFKLLFFVNVFAKGVIKKQILATAGNRTGLLFMIPSKILVKQSLVALLFFS
jgi:hypothetical protein